MSFATFPDHPALFHLFIGIAEYKATGLLGYRHSELAQVFAILVSATAYTRQWVAQIIATDPTIMCPAACTENRQSMDQDDESEQMHQ